MWWAYHNCHGAFAAQGVHGQTIYVDPTAQMVIVRFASHPKAGEAVAEYLLGRRLVPEPQRFQIHCHISAHRLQVLGDLVAQRLEFA